MKELLIATFMAVSSFVKAPTPSDAVEPILNIKIYQIEGEIIMEIINYHNENYDPCSEGIEHIKELLKCSKIKTS